LFLVGRITLTIGVGASVSQLAFDFALNPFRVISSLATISVTADPQHSANVPFDFLISCEAETFKLYVDGVIIADSLSNFHYQNGVKNPMPQVKYIFVNPNQVSVSKASWTYGNLESFDIKLQKYIVRVSVASNGILGTIIGMSPTPTISSFSLGAQVPIPYFSTILYIFQDANKMETRYLPVQAVQNCFR